jgi:phage/plasmid-like protein (TIGR03299 family)
MAHKLNFNTKSGTYSFASHAEKAWHGLGQIVQEAMTAEQAIKLANMDYDVQKCNIHGSITLPDGGIMYQNIDGRVGTYRTDTKEMLGIVSDRYEIVQNRDAFGFFDAIIDSGEAIFETAGVIGKGEKIFLTAKLPKDLLVNGEPCEKYIILTNSHDASSSLIAGFTTVRIVCNNTLQAAMRDLSNKVTIQHKGNAKSKIAEAYKVMGIASRYMQEVEEVFNKMSEVKIDSEQLRKYVIDVMKPEYHKDQPSEEMSTRLINQVDSIILFANTHHTQQTSAAKDTVWGAYNAISGYYNYIHNFKSNEQKFESQMFGVANKRILKAYDKAIELI